MSTASDPMPDHPAPNDDVVIQRLLRSRRVAIVGLSDDPAKDSFGVGQYLADHGYDVTPINPTRPTVLGRQAFKSIADLPGPPQLVLVFRKPEHCADVAREAIAAGATGLWLQVGIRNEDARKLAEAAGIDFVQDRCMMVEHARMHWER